MKIAQTIAGLRRAIREKATAVGRIGEEIKLVLVTKGISVSIIREAYEAGIRDFGENRVQELTEKKKELPSDICWHMIGRLQTNKVKALLSDVRAHGCAPVHLIHSLDRPELAAAIERQAEQKNIREVPCLVQVNASGEATKAGFRPEEVASFVEGLKKESRIQIKGLMTIGPLSEDLETIRQAFRKAALLKKDLMQKFPEKDWGILSMGMSGDWPSAIEEGATCLRIGTAVFGERMERPFYTPGV